MVWNMVTLNCECYRSNTFCLTIAFHYLQIENILKTLCGVVLRVSVTRY